MPEEDLVELKFRLYDGSDIGPFRYSPASTVAMLKERIVTEWPKGLTFPHCVFMMLIFTCARRILHCCEFIFVLYSSSFVIKCL